MPAVAATMMVMVSAAMAAAAAAAFLHRKLLADADLEFVHA